MNYVAFERAGQGDDVTLTAAPTPGRRRPSGWHLLLIPLALVMVVPFVWLVITSFSTLAETRTFPPTLPAGFPVQWIENAIHNYGDASRRPPSAVGC